MNAQAHDPADAVEGLVQQLLATCSSLGQILAHMERNKRFTTAQSRSSEEILRDLLRETVAEVAGRHGPDAVRAASAVVSACVTTIAEDIFLVPLGPPPFGNRAVRRARPRR